MKYTEAAVGNVDNVIATLRVHFRTRFQSFDEDEVKQTLWMDPSVADEDDEDVLEQFMASWNHFKLVLGGDDKVPSRVSVLKEFKCLNKVYRNKFRGKKLSKLWQHILCYKSDGMPHLAKLATLIMTIGVSNCIVERSFSQLNSMLNERRLCLLPSTMENLLIVKANHHLFVEDERKEIIDMALDRYLSTRQKRKLSSPAHQVKKRKTMAAANNVAEVDSSSSSEVDSDNSTDSENSVDGSDDSYASSDSSVV
jgi:hypothetical protein